MYNPYESTDGFWVKANFHTHTQMPDLYAGQGIPAEHVVEMYTRSGYDWLTLSNHDRSTDLSNLQNGKLNLLPGIEYSHSNHMLLLGIEKMVSGETHQQVIDEVREQGGVCVVCHPHWLKEDYWPWEKINALHGFHALEIYDAFIFREGGTGIATDTWDKLLCKGQYVCGIGSDDFHDYIDLGRVYNLLYLQENTPQAVLRAIKEKRVCVSTGLYPEYLRVEEGVLRVKARYAMPNYRSALTYKFYGDGELLYSCTAEEASFAVSNQSYIRVEAEGENGAKIYFQPVIFLRKGKR